MKSMMERRVSQRAESTATPSRSGKTKRSRADRAAVKKLMLLLKSGADTRVKKVKRIRQSVRSRSYENELKLSIASERLARELSV